MKRIAIFSLGLMCFISSFPAYSDASHWLVGTWNGQVEAKSSNRTMIITNVSPDGAAKGGWGISNDPPIGSAEINVTGEKVDVRVVNSGSRVTLEHNGSDQLTGSITSDTGKVLPIMLTRIKEDIASKSVYEGKLYASGKCFANTTIFKVAIQADKVRGEWGYEAGSTAKFVGQVTDKGFIANRTSSRSGETQKIEGTKVENGYDVAISGDGCRLSGTIKR